MKAFILGAGLGTRLRPLTNRVPKPLVPVFHRPLATYAMDHCLAAGVNEFAVNTHYLPEAWEEAFVGGRYQDAGTLQFFHEPVLLETGGGLKNIESFVGDDSLLVFNGDILTDFPIEKLMAEHRASGNVATLGLRTQGAEMRIRVEGEQVVDLRGELTGLPGTHQFTGIYVIEPELLDLIPANEKISVIPAFWELAKAGKLGACVVDDCYWHDLGNRDEYLAAHKSHPELGEAVHAEAVIGEGAVIENSVIGPGSVVGAGARVVDSVLWAGSRVEAEADLTRCVVCSEKPVSGVQVGVDLA